LALAPFSAHRAHLHLRRVSNKRNQWQKNIAAMAGVAASAWRNGGNMAASATA
jgi:hypothetical protein